MHCSPSKMRKELENVIRMTINYHGVRAKVINSSVIVKPDDRRLLDRLDGRLASGISLIRHALALELLSIAMPIIIMRTSLFCLDDEQK